MDHFVSAASRQREATSGEWVGGWVNKKIKKDKTHSQQIDE